MPITISEFAGMSKPSFNGAADGKVKGVAPGVYPVTNVAVGELGFEQSPPTVSVTFDPGPPGST